MGVEFRRVDPNKGIPADFPGQVMPAGNGGNIVISKVDELINWSRANSLWPLTFATSCCAIEMMATGASKHDWSRFGTEVARASARQADLIIIAGTIADKVDLVEAKAELPAGKTNGKAVAWTTIATRIGAR